MTPQPNLAQVMAQLARAEAISGLFNCHKKGLHSIVLQERQSPEVGMTRIFYAAEGHTLGRLITDGEFSLLPHNHRQDIKLELLWGVVDNEIYKQAHKDECDTTLYEHQFSSAILDGQIGLDTLDFVPMSEYSRDQIGCGVDAIHLEAKEIHTVVVCSKTAAWVVYEGRQSNKPSLCYSIGENPMLSTEGLYIPMTPTELRIICTEMIKECR